MLKGKGRGRGKKKEGKKERERGRGRNKFFGKFFDEPNSHASRLLCGFKALATMTYFSR